jgi:tRNA(Arg) A34 adenosine deaminase TadA
MCSGAIGWSDVGRLVYGLSQRRMYEVYAGNTPRWAEPPSCRAILATVVPPLEIVGPLLEGEAVEPHRYWVKVNT